MPKLTADQVFQLAQSYHKFARELGDYRFAEWDKLTAAERQTLETKERLIRNFSSSFNGLSLKMELDALQGTLDKISKASAGMQKALKKLATINKVLNVAALIISLGTSVLTGNVNGIISGIDDVLTAFE